jgi:hypothetical protein
MKLVSRKAVTGVSALGLASILGVAMAGQALAAPSPYDPSANGATQGTLSFYDATGNQVTTGPLATPPAFALADTDTGRAGDTQATLYAATPVKGADPLTWPNDIMSVTHPYPDSSAPGVLQNNPHALAAQIFQWFDSNGYPGSFPNNNSDAAWQNFYQLRILTSGPGQAVDPSRFASATIEVNSANNTWTQIYPAPPAKAPTTTALSANPPSPQTTPASAITLTANVTDSAPGTVVFRNTDTNTQVGSTQTLPGSGGGANNASVTIPAGLAVGTHHYQATYTPAAGANFDPSTSSTISYVVNGRNTNVSLSVNHGTEIGQSMTFTSTATDAQSPNGPVQGTVAWWDNGSPVTGASSHTDGTGTASATSATGFGLGTGSHSIVAHFTPDDTATYGPSTSQPVTFTLSPKAGDPCNNADGVQDNANDPRSNTCIDPQTAVVTVDNGTLVISTPWTPSNPFDLGHMQLAPDGSYLHTTAANSHFGDATNPANGVTVTDTRAGNPGWTAALASTNFQSGGGNQINACNLGFTSVTPRQITGNALQAADVVPTQLPNGGAAAIAPATSTTCTTGLGQANTAKNFATVAQNKGTGSVYITGDMDLYAPTSTPAGLYTATLTFTVF